jgi:hypothetical protein
MKFPDTTQIVIGVTEKDARTAICRYQYTLRSLALAATRMAQLELVPSGLERVGAVRSGLEPLGAVCRGSGPRQLLDRHATPTLQYDAHPCHSLMSSTKLIVSALGLAAALAIGTAIYEYAATQKLDRRLTEQANVANDLRGRLQATEGKLAAADARARAAEDDNAKLIAAVRTSAAAQKAEAAAAAVPLTQNSVNARYQHARQLARTGDPAEALKELLWCFDEGMPRVSGFGGVRLSYLLEDIKKLGEKYPAALDALRERRDAAEKLLHASATDFDAGQTFAAINRTLGEQDRTIAWFDQIDPATPRRHMIAMLAFDPLVEAKRYTDALAGHTYAQMSSSFEMFAHDTSGPRGQYLVTSTAKNIEVLAGAGDLAHARSLAQRLLSVDHSEATVKLLNEHLARAGHPDLLTEPASTAAP